jgi:hypothetical protein
LCQREQSSAWRSGYGSRAPGRPRRSPGRRCGTRSCRATRRRAGREVPWGVRWVGRDVAASVQLANHRLPIDELNLHVDRERHVEAQSCACGRVEEDAEPGNRSIDGGLNRHVQPGWGAGLRSGRAILSLAERASSGAAASTAASRSAASARGRRRGVRVARRSRSPLRPRALRGWRTPRPQERPAGQYGLSDTVRLLRRHGARLRRVLGPGQPERRCEESHGVLGAGLWNA